MNPSYYGDSYDVVKRFFCAELMTLGYTVVARPMFTGTWNGAERRFLRFIGAAVAVGPSSGRRVALFVDPDTGVHHKASKKHVAIDTLVADASAYRLVFAFDQSFSRGRNASVAMRHKLDQLAAKDCRGMYYDSHARFLFVSRRAAPLAELRRHLEDLGMPQGRFVHGASE